MSYQQHNPPHPGKLILRTYIEPFEGLTANRVADRLGVARSTFNRLLNGKSGVSPEMAVRLSKVLGGSAESWLTLQQNFDLYKARQAIDINTLKQIEIAKWHSPGPSK